MANVVSMVSRLTGEIKKNGMKNTWYKVIEKRAKWEYDSIILPFLKVIL